MPGRSVAVRRATSKQVLQHGLLLSACWGALLVLPSWYPPGPHLSWARVQACASAEDESARCSHGDHLDPATDGARMALIPPAELSRASTEMACRVVGDCVDWSRASFVRGGGGRPIVETLPFPSLAVATASQTRAWGIAMSQARLHLLARVCVWARCSYASEQSG